MIREAILAAGAVVLFFSLAHAHSRDLDRADHPTANVTRMPRTSYLAPSSIFSRRQPEAPPLSEVPGTTTGIRLHITDSESGQPTPARVEILDSSQNSILPLGALPIAGECDSTPGTTGATPTGAVAMPVSANWQFYASKPLDIGLAPGRYRITIQKGIEFERQSFEIEVDSGEKQTIHVELSRWADMAAQQWFSSDAHLHIPRTEESDGLLLDWMEAEDLNVANLLQMGSPFGIRAARQPSFGHASVARRGNTILASGQENPRAWILGHGIILGGDSYIDVPEEYLDYQRAWRQAAAQNALVGYAHFFDPGVWVDLPTGLIDFLEVLQFGAFEPEGIYAALNLGIRIAPTAGTDFPCYPSSPPGAERFYTRVEGPLTFDSWMDGVHAGRTFVTNGPLVDISVDGVGIGEELVLPGAQSVRATAAVRFDPGRDDVSVLELVRAGRVIHRERAGKAEGRIEFTLEIPMEESTWLAVRAKGTKVRQSDAALSVAHSGAVFVVVSGTTNPIAREFTLQAANQALDDLEDLEARFEREALLSLQTPLAQGLTGITPEIGLRDRMSVLDAIERARSFYRSVGNGLLPTSLPQAHNDATTKAKPLPPDQPATSAKAHR